MDREEAIKVINKHFPSTSCGEYKELIEALKMAIEALSQPNYETDTEVRLAVTNRKKEKVILWDAYGEVEYYPIESLSAEPTDLISRADAVAKAKYLVNRWIGVTGKAYEEKVPLIEEVFNAIPSAGRLNIAYICDGKACGGECDECHHTTDIKHAKNFNIIGGKYNIKYIETDYRPSGEWIMHIDDLYPEESTQECSNCHEHETIKINNDNYCPNCGAKMGGNK